MSEKKRLKKRIRLHTRLISALLAAVMLFAILPMSAFAAGDDEDAGNAQEIPWEDLQSYLKPFDGANESMDRTFWKVLQFMEEYLASLEQQTGAQDARNTAYNSEEAFMSQYLDTASPNPEIDLTIINNYAGNAFSGIQDGMDQSCVGVLTLMNRQVNELKSSLDVSSSSASSGLLAMREARSKFIRNLCPKNVSDSEEELEWADIQSYVGSPFTGASESMKRRYQDILKFMNKQIKQQAKKDNAVTGSTLSQMLDKRDQFVLEFMPIDVDADKQSWYSSLTKSWASMTGSERMAYLSQKYNEAASTFADLSKTSGQSGSAQKLADSRLEMIEWKARFLAFAPYDDTGTNIERPEWCMVSNAEWNELTSDEVQDRYDTYYSIETSRTGNSSATQEQWKSYAESTINNVSWQDNLKQRDLSLGVEMDNTYALTVTTGTSDGSGVLYFGVVYKSGGQEYMQMILPNDGDLDRSLKVLDSIDRNTQREEKIAKDIFGYTVQTSSQIKPLQPYRTDTYLFKPTHTIDSISRVQVYLSTDGEEQRDSTTWSCQSLRVSHIEKLYGLRAYGYVSNQYFVRYDGEMLAQTTAGFDLTASPAMLYNLPTDSWSDAGTIAEEYHLAVPSGDDAAITADKQDYIFRLDLADIWDGGIRGLASEVSDNQCGLSALKLPEAMTLSVRYQDKYGAYCDAKIPVVISSLGYAVEKGVLTGDSVLTGFAQQGDSLAVAASLPDLQSISEVKLTYGTQKAVEAAGLVNSDSGTRKAERVTAIAGQKEVYLTGVAVYSADNVNLQLNAEGNALAPEYNGEPVLCYTSQTAEGSGLNADTDWIVPLAAYEGQNLTPEENDNRYLIRLTTDSAENAGTTSDIQLSLKYRDKAGREKTTGVYDVHELVNDYYGYWPSSDGSLNYAYYYGADRGHTMEFQITLEDADTFLGCTVGIGSGSDDWQMSKIEILRLTERSARVIGWQSVSTSDGDSSDRMITRAVIGDSVLTQETAVLCQRGQDKDLTFGKSDGTGSNTGKDDGNGNSGSNSGGVVTDAEEDVDWRSSQYSLDYEQASRDFGFAKERMAYTVKVKVANSVSSASSSQTDDAGSKNLFYFQLVFGDQDGTSGTSAYVLANQQLNADGFRSGTEETFTIRTNRNYGELRAVNIIPDDTSGNSDIYDKLNIDSIKVVKQSSTALAKTWIINDVGWVGIDYKEDGAQTSITGQPARYASQIERSYLVDSSSYSVNLLFELTTDSYDAKGMNNKDADDPQFQGSVNVTLQYRDNSGILQSVSYDMVDLMYQYANRTPSKDTITSNGITTNGNAQSDPSFMFRANKTDRFVIPVDSVSSLLKVTLRVNGTVTTTWNIKGLSVSTFGDNGTLLLNSKGEYQRGGTSEYLCSDSLSASNTTAIDETTGLTRTAHYSVQSIIATDAKDGKTYGTDQNLIINFAANTLNIDEQEETISCVSRLPQSSNDKVNVYVLPKDGTAAANELEGTLKYSLTGNSNRDMTNTFTLSRYTDTATRQTMYYATGLTASNLQQLSTLSLSNTADERQWADIRISSAIVQIVRSNVVIGTYLYDFGDLNVYGGQSAEPADTSVMNNEVQEATLTFGENTVAATLSENSPNIAVALRYTVTYDPTEHVYYSPYVFLTDQEYTAIMSGQSATIQFNEPYVKSIAGLMVVDVGNISADYGPAYAAVYTQNGDARTLESYYSLASEGTIGSTGIRVFRTTEERSKAGSALAAATNNTVMNLMLTFTTPTQDSGGDPGTTMPVRAEIHYLDYNGASHTRTISDLRKYIVSNANGETAAKGSSVTTASTFAAGSTIQVNIPMTGIKEVERVTLEPYGAAGANSAKASWKPDTMRVVLRTEGTEAAVFDRSVQISKRLYEGKPTNIYVKDIQITVDASYPGQSVVQTATNGGTVAGLIEPGQCVTIKATLDGTKDGYIITAEYREEKDGAPTSASDCIQNDGKGNIVFTAPKRNDTGSIQYYTLKIAYADDSDLAVTVQIDVKKSDPLTEETPSSNSGDSTTENASETPQTSG